jgi:hypothetical protein
MHRTLLCKSQVKTFTIYSSRPWSQILGDSISPRTGNRVTFSRMQGTKSPKFHPWATPCVIFSKYRRLSKISLGKDTFALHVFVAFKPTLCICIYTDVPGCLSPIIARWQHLLASSLDFIPRQGIVHYFIIIYCVSHVGLKVSRFVPGPGLVLSPKWKTWELMG